MGGCVEPVRAHLRDDLSARRTVPPNPRLWREHGGATGSWCAVSGNPIVKDHSGVVAHQTGPGHRGGSPAG